MGIDSEQHSAGQALARDTEVSAAAEQRLPAPPVPPEIDLRGLEYMPLFGAHLFGSEFNASASDSEWRTAITLWWAAWTQVPAGSLPADDAALTRLADLGRDTKRFRRVKAKALHGFFLCSDGRLYHGYICQQALIAFDKRVKDRKRKAEWRAKREHEGNSVLRDETVTRQGRDAAVRIDGNRRDGTGIDGTGRDAFNALDPTSVASGQDQGDQAALCALACRLMKEAGCKGTNPSNLELRAAISEGVKPEALVDAAREAIESYKHHPFKWAVQAARGRHRDGPQQVASAAPAKETPPAREFFQAKQTDPKTREAFGARLGSLVRRLSGGEAGE